MDQTPFFQDFFLLLATLFPKNKLTKAYNQLKSLYTQKPGKLKAFLEKNPDLKNIIYRILATKDEKSLQENLKIVLSVWYEVGFFDASEEEEIMKNFRLNNPGLRDFLEEIAFMLDIEILYCDSHRQNVFDIPQFPDQSIAAPVTERLIIYYDSNEEGWLIRRNIANSLTKDFKSFSFLRVIPCYECKKMVFYKRENAIQFERCGHLLCSDCGKGKISKSNSEYCDSCRKLFEEFEENELEVCRRCECGYLQENLVECRRCKKKNCKLCFFRYGKLSKKQDSVELLCSQCVDYK